MHDFTGSICGTHVSGALPNKRCGAVVILANAGDVVVTMSGSSITLPEGTQLLFSVRNSNLLSTDAACGYVVHF